MKAIVVTDRRTGSVKLADRPVPRPKPGELLVRVRAAGVNPADWKVRSGALGWLLSPAIPEIPGLDVAGVVEAVGGGSEARAAALQPGSPVVGLTAFGGAFAEFAVVKVSAAARKPDGLSFAEAAAIPVAGLTALQALRDRAKLARGQHLLVNGAAGGVGTFAVQIGRELGAHVTAVTSARNAEMVAELGAERVIDYARENFTLLADQYEVILDAVANVTFRACVPRLAPRGTYITTLPGVSNLVSVGLTSVGVGEGKRAFLANVQPRGADLARLAEMAVQGKVRPVLERVLPLAEAGAAFVTSRVGHVRGKLVLSVSEESPQPPLAA